MFLFLLAVQTASPGVTAPASFTQPADAQQGSEQSVTEPWWEVVDDPHLKEHIVTGLRNNYNLAAAAQRVAQAEALSLTALSPLLPTLSADGSVSVGPVESRGFGIIPGGSSDLGGEVSLSGSALLNLRYRVDVVGASYMRYRAADLQAEASRGDGDGIALALVQQIAAAYYDAVAARQQMALVETQVTVSKNLAELTQLRFERGAATGLAVLQQRQQLAATRANLPAARSQFRVSLQRLALLTGKSPSKEAPATAAALPDLGQTPNLGAPADLMRHRPDLRAAASRVDAAADQASAAFRAHFPTLDLSANAGWQMFYSSDDCPSAFGGPGGCPSPQPTWGASALLSIPIFSGLSALAGTNSADAAEGQAVAALNQGLLQAIGEVESSLVQEQELTAQLDAFQDQLTASQQAYDESTQRYIAGLSTYLDVLNALNSKQAAELNSLRLRRSLLAARVQLFHALGGPWTEGLRGRSNRNTTSGGRS